MNLPQDIVNAEHYLKTLCEIEPNRRTGSPGNQEATDFFAGRMRALGYEIEAIPFDCLDHACHGAQLCLAEESFDIHASPYTVGCDLRADLMTVSTPDELESSECRGKILLLRGEICSEQLMPKNFVFYNPEHHRKIVALLEEKQPAAVITATGKKPDQVGALYPFPLIVDGDFDIPSVFCRDAVGELLAGKAGQPFSLRIDAQRIQSTAVNVIARLNPGAGRKIVLTAHIDAYENSPGALDNASGVVVLLLAAGLLTDYQGGRCVEIAALNGEDHYSAGGQMDYLKRHGAEFPRIQLVINIDDVGYKVGGAAYSFYECPAALEAAARGTLSRSPGLVAGEPWFNGDHMIFVQNKVPALAFTAERSSELMSTVTHTAGDVPGLIDLLKLIELAQALSTLVASL